MKPSVLHVYKDYYPPVQGGMEKSIHWMADQTRGDFVVRVLVASRTRSFVDEQIDGVRVVRVGCLGRVLSSPIAPGFVTWLRRLDSDILHFHMPNPMGELAYLIARPRRGRVVVTYHSDIVRQRLTGLLYAPLQRAFLSRARLIMPTSQRYLETSATLRPHRDRCRVVPLGIPLETYEESESSRAFGGKIRAQTPGKIRIVFLGVLRYYKGLTFLLEAMRDLPREACLCIGGEGPERATLERRAAELGIADRVLFLGELSHDEAVGLLRAGDVFCLPAHLRSEAFGLSQIEAMACGLPVVSTNLPTGVPEVNRDGETGRVVQPANPGALRDALTLLIADPDARRRMGQAGRSRAHALYSARRMGDDLKRAYSQVLAYA